MDWLDEKVHLEEEVARRGEDLTKAKACIKELERQLADNAERIDCQCLNLKELTDRNLALEIELNIFLKAKCPACGYQGKLSRMKSEKGYVSKPGEYWCPACNSNINVAHLQFVNEELIKKIERLENEK